MEEQDRVDKEESENNAKQAPIDTEDDAKQAPIDTEDEESLIEIASSVGLHILADLHTVYEEMQHLRQDFDTKIKYDVSKGQLIDSLHHELQVYREGFHFKILRPLFMDLIAMHDDLCKLIEDPLLQEEQGQFSRTLQSFLETIEEILRRNGVDVFQIDEAIFTASRQRTLKTIGTSDPALDKHIASRVRKGFLYEERLLRPELVNTYTFDPTCQKPS